MALTCGNGNTLHYNTIICFFTHFPLHKSSVPNRCQTSHESLAIKDGLPGGQQVHFQTETKLFLCLHVQTNLVVHPTSCRRAL